MVVSNAVLEIRGGRVVSCDRRDRSADRDLGERVLLPGFINAHVHLDLTALGGSDLPKSGFVLWARALMAERSGWTPEDHRRSVRDGVAKGLAAGTTAVGDIDGTGAALAAAELPGIAFQETMGFEPEVAAARASEVADRIDRSSARELRPGLSPHAPTSCSPDLYRALDALASRRRWRLSTHVAETLEELELLRSGQGPFRELLEDLGKLPEDWRPPGCSPIAALARQGVLRPEMLLVHANYLEDGDIDSIAGAGCSVVYCPRSHAWFGHDPHPWPRLRQSGVTVALGTDSLASNDSLSMLDEVRHLAGLGCDPETAFEMATLGGAAALGHEGGGSLRDGARADFAVLEPGPTARTPILERLLEPEARIVSTWIGGRERWPTVEHRNGD